MRAMPAYGAVTVAISLALLAAVPALANSAADVPTHGKLGTLCGTFPNKPLYVADPALNAIVVYKANLTGSPILPTCMYPASTADKLNKPIAVAAGKDCLPAPTGCGKFLWVSNLGTNQTGSSITVYKIPLVSPLVAVNEFSADPNLCATAISGPYGIAHAKARLYITNEGTNEITLFHANATGPSCPWKTIAGTPTGLSTPSGPSVSFPDNPLDPQYVFNANVLGGTATGFQQNANGGIAPLLLWNTGGQPEGTAFDWHLGYLWMTTSSPTKALWRCQPLPLPSTCASANSPQIAGSLTLLSSPQLPAVSIELGRVYAPNYTGDTVTAYPETASGNVAPIAKFTGLSHPIGTAIENAPD
jgi:hypothetical protein